MKLTQHARECTMAKKGVEVEGGAYVAKQRLIAMNCADVQVLVRSERGGRSLLSLLTLPRVAGTLLIVL